MIYIYTLTDPNTNMVRYVGKTNNLNNRLKSHICTAKKYNSHKNNWIKKLLIMNLKPIIDIIDIIDDESYWEPVEQYWISQFKTWGFNLVNVSDGGENPPILKSHSEETKQKLSLIKKEYFTLNPHHRKGIKHTKEHIDKILKTKKNNPMVYNYEVKKNMSDAHLVYSNSPCAQYTLNGELVKIWDRVIDAIHYYNTTRILKVCQNKGLSSKDFIWSFNLIECELYKIKSTKIKIIKPITHTKETIKPKIVKSRIHSEETKLKISKGNLGKKKHSDEFKNKLKVKIIQLTLDGKFIKKWNSINDAKIIYKGAKISDCLSGRLKTSCGFKWIKDYD